jgi:GH35 family endo-1,4-beta-xylanase
MTCLGPEGVMVALALVLVLALAAQAEGGPAPLAADQVNQRIQEHRTADVTLTVLEPGGKPLANQPVTVRQTRHQFLFGANAFLIDTDDTSPDQVNYQKRFAALLNYATLPFYWGAFEPEQGQPHTERLRMMAAWCQANGIRAKGHPLCWHEVPCKWLQGKSLDDVKRLQLERITREGKGFAGLIDTWDVVNEACAMPGYGGGNNPIGNLAKEIGNVKLIRETFAAARQANPKAMLLLNDYDTSPKYEALLKDCLAAGVTIDVIGIQSHMHGGYWGAAKTWETCERFARFGKPLHFTELTILSAPPHPKMDWHTQQKDWDSTPDGEKRQCEQVTEFYRLLFSHSAVRGITWWDFSDKHSWQGAPSGLVRKDMSPKPAYEALMGMVKKEWWTGPLELKTDAQGRVKFRGFLGDYSVQYAGGSGLMQLQTPGEKAVQVQTLK